MNIFLSLDEKVGKAFMRLGM